MVVAKTCTSCKSALEVEYFFCPQCGVFAKNNVVLSSQQTKPELFNTMRLEKSSQQVRHADMSVRTDYVPYVFAMIILLMAGLLVCILLMLLVFNYRDTHIISMLTLENYTNVSDNIVAVSLREGMIFL